VRLLVFTVIGLSAWLVAYAFALGGAVGFLIFLGILFVAVCMRIFEPLMQRLRP
jgi:ABC-type nitrate/sulfonate/bicarbonate transport system permease component